MFGKRCKNCKRTSPATKLTYSIVQGDELCLHCYKVQFPQKPIAPKPIIIT